MAEAEDLKSSQCGFDPHSGHRYRENTEKYRLGCSKTNPIGIEHLLLSNYDLKSLRFSGSSKCVISIHKFIKFETVSDQLGCR